jgi:hypothetical protein
LDKGVTELVKYHLRETVIRIHSSSVGEDELTVSVSGGVGVGAAAHSKASSRSAAEPDCVEWVDVLLCDYS